MEHSAFFRRAPALGALLGAIVLGGCGLSPEPEAVAPPAANMHGTWTGSVSSEDGTGFGSLQIVQSEMGLQITMTIPDMPLTATGTGSLVDRTFRADLTFTRECPGTITLTGNLRSDTELQGTARMVDCNAEVTGSFNFILRSL